MKKIFFCLFSVIITGTLSAQNLQTDSVKVSGNCGMCKKNIEKAAKLGGASNAVWNKTSKVITLSFDLSKTSLDKIQTAIAAAGYDTESKLGNDQAYEKLEECCKYDRSKKPSPIKKQ